MMGWFTMAFQTVEKSSTRGGAGPVMAAENFGRKLITTATERDIDVSDLQILLHLNAPLLPTAAWLMMSAVSFS